MAVASDNATLHSLKNISSKMYALFIDPINCIFSLQKRDLVLLLDTATSLGVQKWFLPKLKSDLPRSTDRDDT